MAYIIYDTLWKSQFCENVSAKARVQDLKPNQLNFKVNDSYTTDEKITTNFEASNPEAVINRSVWDKKISKIESQIRYRKGL